MIWWGVDYWEPLRSPDVVLLGSPDRVWVDEKPDPAMKPRPAGFVLPKPQVEPKIWEGDNA